LKRRGEVLMGTLAEPPRDDPLRLYPKERGGPIRKKNRGGDVGQKKIKKRGVHKRNSLKKKKRR